MKNIYRAFNLLLATCLLTSISLEASPADSSGTRSSSGLLAPDNNQIIKNGLIGNILSLPYSIDWNITNGVGTTNYVYSVSNTPLLGLSLTQDRLFIESAGASAADLNNVQLNNFIILNAGSNYYDAVVGGVSGIMFDVSGVLGLLGSVGVYDLAFDVDAAAEWGDFSHDLSTTSLFGGLLSGSVNNAGFANIPATGSGLAGHIATIGAVRVPEPSTYFLLGSMLLMAAYVKRKKNKLA